MSRATAAFLVALSLAATTACDKVPLLAPTQSTITLTISTTNLPVNGTAQVIATVIEQAGTPVHNGTLVTFTMSATASAPPSNSSGSGPIAVTSAGRTTQSDRNTTFDTVGVGSFERSDVPTENGRAVTTFRAGTTSGTVNIGAISGGASATTIAVNVGGAAVAAILVQADPPTVPESGGTTTVTATVLDASGNPLAGAPVLFSTSAGNLSATSAISDANGVARVSLQTSRETTVTVSSGVRQNTVTVRALSLPVVTITLSSGSTSLEAGLPITFTVTPTVSGTSSRLRNVIVDYGDNTRDTLGGIQSATTVSHVYARAGIYKVTAIATDIEGLTGESSIIINVNEQSPLTVSLVAAPNPVSIGSALQQGIVDFTATASGATGGFTYFWAFGDGRSAVTNSGSINTRYTAPGTYTARVTVRAANGQEGYAERQIRVNP